MKNLLKLTEYFVQILILPIYIVANLLESFKEKLLIKKEKGELKRFIPFSHNIFIALILYFCTRVIESFDIIVAKNTFFSQEILELSILYFFILMFWYFKKVYLSSENEEIALRDGVAAAIAFTVFAKLITILSF